MDAAFWDGVADIASAVLLLCGAFLAFAAGVGVVRFPDLLARMHAATKPQVLGLILVLLGLSLRLRSWGAVATLALVVVFQLLTSPVAAHMVADVPVSAFLSGGLDSSLITVIAARLGHNVEGYTISFREADRKLEAMPDDLHYARIIATQNGIKLHEIEIAPDVADMLPRMVHKIARGLG